MLGGSVSDFKSLSILEYLHTRNEIYWVYTPSLNINFIYVSHMLYIYKKPDNNFTQRIYCAQILIMTCLMRSDVKLSICDIIRKVSYFGVFQILNFHITDVQQGLHKYSKVQKPEI